MECPACGFENLEGADLCDECGVSLTSEDLQTSQASIDRKKGIVNDPIQKVSLRDPVLVALDTPVSQVIKQMKQKKVGCALIIEGKNLAGIFTERDILYKIAKPEIDLEEIEIAHVMTPSPEVLDESDTIAYALNKMAMGNFRHVPIQRQDGSFTFFSARDMLRYLF